MACAPACDSCLNFVNILDGAGCLRRGEPDRHAESALMFRTIRSRFEIRGQDRPSERDRRRPARRISMATARASRWLPITDRNGAVARSPSIPTAISAKPIWMAASNSTEGTIYDVLEVLLKNLEGRPSPRRSRFFNQARIALKRLDQYNPDRQGQGQCRPSLRSLGRAL